jgi:hypothetical protein
VAVDITSHFRTPHTRTHIQTRFLALFGQKLQVCESATLCVAHSARTWTPVGRVSFLGATQFNI